MVKDNPITTIKILTLMQLGDKMDTTVFMSRKRFLLKLLFGSIIMVIVAAVIYALMSLVQSVLQVPITSHLLVFVLICMQVMGIVACTGGLLKTLYQSKDNALLLSYPAKHNEVFISKIIVYYILEVIRNLNFLLPFLLAFGVFKLSVVHWTFFLNAAIMTAVLPLICVLISALLSLPVMFIADFLKGQTIITSIFVLGVVGGFFYLVIIFLESLPANLELVAYYKRVLTEFAAFLVTVGQYGLYLICVRKIFETTPETMLNAFGNYGILIGVIVVFGALVFLLTMPLYFRIASHAVEMAHVSHKTKMKDHKSTFFTFLAKEFKLSLRDSDSMLNNFIYLMLMPFLLFIMNKVFSLVNTNLIGEKIVTIINVCLGLTMVMVSNTSSATAISSEGNEFYLLKTAPSKTRQIAWAKVTVNLVLSTIAIVASTVCIAVMTTQLTKTEVFYIFFIFMTVNTSHVLWSFEFDLLNPQVKEYIAAGTALDSKNANRSMALGVGLAFITAAILGLLLFYEPGDKETQMAQALDMSSSEVAWAKILIIVTVFLICRIYLFTSKLTLYFDDIEM